MLLPNWKNKTVTGRTSTMGRGFIWFDICCNNWIGVYRMKSFIALCCFDFVIVLPMTVTVMSTFDPSPNSTTHLSLASLWWAPYTHIAVLRRRTLPLPPAPLISLLTSLSRRQLPVTDPSPSCHFLLSSNWLKTPSPKGFILEFQNI